MPHESFPTPIPSFEPRDPNKKPDTAPLDAENDYAEGPLDAGYFDFNVKGTLLPTLEKYIEDKKNSSDPATQKDIEQLNKLLHNKLLDEMTNVD